MNYNSFNVIKVFKTKVTRSQGNGKDNAKILSLQSISGDVADNVSHPLIFVLYLQHGRHDVNAHHQLYIVHGLLVEDV